jgi:hypothetical protein
LSNKYYFIQLTTAKKGKPKFSTKERISAFAYEFFGI